MVKSSDYRGKLCPHCNADISPYGICPTHGEVGEEVLSNENANLRATLAATERDRDAARKAVEAQAAIMRHLLNGEAFCPHCQRWGKPGTTCAPESYYPCCDALIFADEQARTVGELLADASGDTGHDVAAMRTMIVKLCRVQPHGTDIHCPVCKRAWTIDAVLHGGMTHAPGCLAASPLALQILAEEDQR